MALNKPVKSHSETVPEALRGLDLRTPPPGMELGGPQLPGENGFLADPLRTIVKASEASGSQHPLALTTHRGSSGARWHSLSGALTSRTTQLGLSQWPRKLSFLFPRSASSAKATAPHTSWRHPPVLQSVGHSGQLL